MLQKPICNILFVYRDIGFQKRTSNSEYRETEESRGGLEGRQPLQWRIHLIEGAVQQPLIFYRIRSVTMSSSTAMTVGLPLSERSCTGSISDIMGVITPPFCSTVKARDAVIRTAAAR